MNARPTKICEILKRSVERNRAVWCAADLVIAHFSAVEIEIPVWLVADLTCERHDRRNLPVKTRTGPNFTVGDDCVVEAWNSMRIPKLIVHTEGSVPHCCSCIER